MTPLQQALDILGMEPLPKDAYQKLAALESSATGEDKQRFKWIWEGFIVAGGSLPDDAEP